MIAGACVRQPERARLRGSPLASPNAAEPASCELVPEMGGVPVPPGNPERDATADVTSLLNEFPIVARRPPCCR
jgi:hypothetical protein